MIRFILFCFFVRSEFFGNGGKIFFYNDIQRGSMEFSLLVLNLVTAKKEEIFKRRLIIVVHHCLYFKIEKYED